MQKSLIIAKCNHNDFVNMDETYNLQQDGIRNCI